MKFEINDTLAKCKLVKNFMIKNNINYKSIKGETK